MLPPLVRKAIKRKEKGIIYTPDVSDDVSKVDANNFSKALNWENQYIQGNKFKERVEKAGYDYNSYKTNQQRKLRTMSLRADDKRVNNNNDVEAYYREDENDVSVNSKELNTNYYGQEIPTNPSIISHEVGHSFDNENLEKFIDFRNIHQPKNKRDKIIQEEKIKRLGGPEKYYDTFEGHEAAYREVSADVHAARKEIYEYGAKLRGKKKAYDGRYSNFTDQAFEDMRAIGLQNPESASRKLIDKIQRKATESELKTIPNPKNVKTDAQQEEYDNKLDSLDRKIMKDNKQYIFDVMNRVVNNTDTKKINGKTVAYAMNGGMIDRPSSRKRAIVPLIIGAALAVGSAVAGMSAAARARKEQKAQLGKQQLQALSGQYMQQAQGDSQVYNEFNERGQEDINYYANGGNVENSSQNLSPEQMSILKNQMTQSGGMMPNLPVSAGGFQTQGGNLVPIGDGVEEAVGNRHNETSIDGVSGIQLHKDGEIQAEIENKEIVADGNTVYSDRLLYDKNNSYADKMRKLVKKRNKLEAKQEKSTDWRVKDTAERQLAGLNMAEYALYQHQEAKKYNEGIEVANKLAYGGKIRKLAYGGDPTKPFPVYNWMKRFYMTEGQGKYKGYGKNALGQYQDPNDSRVQIDNKGMPMYNYDAVPEVQTVSPMNTKRLGIVSKPMEQVQPNMTLANILGTASNIVGMMGNGTSGTSTSNPDTTSAVTTSNTAATNSATGKTNWGQVASTVGKYAPMFLDNLGNYIATRNTPNIPTPLLDTAQPLETTVNVNPQVAEARRRRRTIGEAILRNTSNSNNAKNNIIASSLAGERNINEILGQKANQELALRNANSQNKQVVNSKNTATMNEYGFRQMQRLNDIQSRDSANLANLQGDIKTIINTQMLDKQFKQNTLANLSDDSLGEKAVLYAQNQEFMNDSANRDFIFQRAQETNADGSPKNPKLVEILKRLYNWGGN